MNSTDTPGAGGLGRKAIEARASADQLFDARIDVQGGYKSMGHAGQGKPAERKIMR